MVLYIKCPMQLAIPMWIADKKMLSLGGGAFYTKSNSGKIIESRCPACTIKGTIGFKIINLARLEGGSCIVIPRRPITQSKLIILKPI
jgi:hypothetical protein